MSDHFGDEQAYGKELPGSAAPPSPVSPGDLRPRGPTVRISGEDVPRPLFLSGVAVIALAVAGFWVLSANPGSGEAEVDDVRAQVRRLAEAVADGDGEGACAAMTDEAATTFAEEVAASADGGTAGCAESVTALAEARDDDESTRLRGIEIVDVRIIGVGEEGLELPDRAEVELEGGTVVLVRESGCAGSPDCWRIEDAGPVSVLAEPGGGGG